MHQELMEQKVEDQKALRKLYDAEKYQRNKIKILKRVKEYRLKNRAKIEEYRTQYNQDHPWEAAMYSARARCTNANHQHYKYYGGRGIKCLMTAEDFKFLWFRDKAYLMKHPSIDRKITIGHYELDNCRYIEMVENVFLANEKQSKKIMQISLNGEILNYFDSIAQANLFFPNGRSNISHCLRGKNKTAYGFKWEYVN